MKNKKFLATLLATSMLMGSSLTVFADDVAITGNTTQEVPMSMTVTAEDLEAAGSLTDVTVRIPARMTLAYKNGSYISTDKVGAFGTLPSYKKVIISNENSDILFKNTDESKTVTGKLTLGMLNENLIVSSEELAAGKADANNIKYSQVTAKVNTKNLENADTFSGTANLKVKIEALTTTLGLDRALLSSYNTNGESYTTWYITVNGTTISKYIVGTTNIKNYKDYITNTVPVSDSSNLYQYYKPNVKILESEYNSISLHLDMKDNNRTSNEYTDLNTQGEIVDNLEEIANTDFLSTPNLELLILPNMFSMSKNCRTTDASNTSLSSKLYNGVFFIKDYDTDNDLFIYIPNISFNGTMEEWNAKADNNWKFPKMANTVTVYCTDGTITYE